MFLLSKEDEEKHGDEETDEDEVQGGAEDFHHVFSEYGFGLISICRLRYLLYSSLRCEFDYLAPLSGTERECKT